MEIIVLSSTEISSTEEIEMIKLLFEEGLDFFHVRRKGYSMEKMREYLNKIPKEYHNRLMLHSHYKLALEFDIKGIHITNDFRKSKYQMWKVRRFILKKKPNLSVSASFHSVSMIERKDPLYQYVFLSPIFDSISKRDYQSGFNEYTLTKALEKTPYRVFALGGVDIDKIDKIKQLGFAGCVLVGSVWTSEDPINNFKEIKNKCKEIAQ